MTDIVELLRSYTERFELSPRIQGKLMLEAADEIERLTALLREIQAYSVGEQRPRHTWYYDRIEAVLGRRAEIERTRA